MGDLDRTGVFRGTVTEMAIGATSKACLPQAIIRLKATERYVEDSAEMKHFELTEPGWVDWSEYDQETLGYFVLINSDGKKNFNFPALERAFGWDGASFAGLGAMNVVGKTVLFRMEENTYEGTTTVRPNSIDAADANIHQGLRKLDADGLRDLDSKFGGTLMAGKKTVAPAAAKAPSKAGTAKPPFAPTARPTGTSSSAKPAATTPAASSAAKSATPKGPPKATAKPAATAPEMDQAAAWDAVEKGTPGSTDDARAEAWLEAAGEICPMREEATFINAEWAAISANAIKRLTTPAVAAK
jgi:hypothetical protein